MTINMAEGKIAIGGVPVLGRTRTHLSLSISKSLTALRGTATPAPPLQVPPSTLSSRERSEHTLATNGSPPISPGFYPPCALVLLQTDVPRNPYALCRCVLLAL